MNPDHVKYLRCPRTGASLSLEAHATEQGRVREGLLRSAAGGHTYPIVGFIPAKDPRMVHTVMEIERTLLHDGFVRRYVPRPEVDGLPGGEGAFLACSFWYVDVLVLLGRYEEARAHFSRLLGLANDVGLLSEEYDPTARRMLGNFPQALSHVALVNTALNLSRAMGPARHRQAM